LPSPNRDKSTGCSFTHNGHHQQKQTNTLMFNVYKHG
jgi:hypothetical protein